MKEIWHISTKDLWGDEMGDVIGRCSSRQEAMNTLVQAKEFLPNEILYAYVAALNRVRYEFRRHEPMEPVSGRCGECGQRLHPGATYCWNCGKEVQK